MRIIFVSDAWTPQVNGVVRTLKNTEQELRALGHQVRMLVPEGRRSVALPFYPEIRLAFTSAAAIGREIESFLPDAIHIATEGPLGLSARRWCLQHKIPFTTAFHTRYAEFMHAMLPLPGLIWLIWRGLRWFHKPSRCVMVPTPSIQEVLKERGFVNVKVWTRGVDHDLFKPYRENPLKALKRPILLISGRVAAEKGIEEFLALDFEGSKVVIGDGPMRAKLEAQFPEVVFTGYLHNGTYARHLAAADCFVFAGKADTFGLVMLEALSSGVPVAAYPVPGPKDVIVDGVSGALDADLGAAVRRALKIPAKAARSRALEFTWAATAKQFVENLAIVPLDR
jgi:glycosyltransferase involved in cell wall biosynthesis